MVDLIITGVGGKMGSTILRCALADPDLGVRHVLEAKGHPAAGSKAEAVVGPGAGDLVVEDDFAAAVTDCDVVIDFTERTASLQHMKAAAGAGKPIVIGTTGFSADDRAAIAAIPGLTAVISPNMSVGVNLLFALVEKAAAVLGEGYDAEIIELHHKWKKDAPSGTALAIKRLIEASKPDRTWQDVTGRSGMWGERKDGELGVFSIRGGDIVGEHTVFFAGIGERVELTHRAMSRENFARGALRAAKWLVGKGPGIYDMRDVLGLKG